jgi:cell division protein FtsW
MFRTIGERTSVNNRKSAARTGKRSKTVHKTLYLGFDLPLFLVAVTLIIFGLLMVYSASYDYSLSWYGDASTIFKRQIAWLGLGLVGAAVLVWLDYHILQRVAVILMGLTLFSLIAVFFTNEVRNNAVRTLLGGSVQPSELAKLVTVIYLAVWLYARRDQLEDVSIGLFPLAAILGLLGGLIFLQPDLSAVATIVFLGGTMFFLAGGALRQIGLLIVGGLLVGWIVVQLSSTGSNRVAEYIQGVKDPMMASYHVRRALEAFANGGWFGVGIGKAATKVTGLPVPPTDSIFAVVGEETGFLGAGGLILLYLTLLWRGLTISRRAPDGLGALLAAGLSLWIALEAFVNMAVMVNLLPFAGNALPFISAGGSNLVVSLAAVGILLNISRKSEQSSEENERTFSAVIDLRRRDRRGRISRSHRSSGYEG